MQHDRYVHPPRKREVPGSRPGLGSMAGGSLCGLTTAASSLGQQLTWCTRAPPAVDYGFLAQSTIRAGCWCTASLCKPSVKGSIPFRSTCLKEQRMISIDITGVVKWP